MNDHAKVLFFANLREKTSVREITIEFPSGSNVADIKRLIVEMYPNLEQNMDTIIVAMNHEFAFDESTVPNEAEIAFFPPVSGGSEDKKKFPNLILVTVHDLDMNSILEQITQDTTGAACIFSGIVRGITIRGNPHQTEELEYEAYRSMAEAKMYQISKEIRSRWSDVEGIAIVQRTGKLPAGTVTVIVACTSAHRDQGIFEAARYGIDRLKEIVPIWKKEVSPDGEVWVEGDYLPHRGD